MAFVPYLGPAAIVAYALAFRKRLDAEALEVADYLAERIERWLRTGR